MRIIDCASGKQKKIYLFLTKSSEDITAFALDPTDKKFYISDCTVCF